MQAKKHSHNPQSKRHPPPISVRATCVTVGLYHCFTNKLNVDLNSLICVVLGLAHSDCGKCKM